MNQESFEKSGAIKLLSTFIGIVIRAFLAATTAGFFATYAYDIWTWLLPPTLAMYTAALTGLVLVDGLAAAWTYLRRTDADTDEQQNYAQIGSWLDMTLSLIVTAVYVVLTTPLLQNSVSPEIYSLMINFASWAGVIIGVISFAGNGLIWHFYANASSAAIAQMHKNEYMVAEQRANHLIDMERLGMQLQQRQENIRNMLPDLTGRAAESDAANYVNRKFGHVMPQQRTDDSGIVTYPAQTNPVSVTVEPTERVERVENRMLQVEINTGMGNGWQPRGMPAYRNQAEANAKRWAENGNDTRVVNSHGDVFAEFVGKQNTGSNAPNGSDPYLR